MKLRPCTTGCAIVEPIARNQRATATSPTIRTLSPPELDPGPNRAGPLNRGLCASAGSLERGDDADHDRADDGQREREDRRTPRDLKVDPERKPGDEVVRPRRDRLQTQESDPRREHGQQQRLNEQLGDDAEPVRSERGRTL